MKLVLVTDAWQPQVNGVVTTLVELVCEMQRLGHHILVIAMTPALVRFVLHLDITDEMLATTIDTIEKL